MMRRITEMLAGIGVDKYIHFIVCQLMAFFVCAASDIITSDVMVSVVASVVVTMSVGAAKEMADDRHPDNRADTMDILADLAGTATGIILWML